MDMLAYLASLEHRADAIIRNAAALQAELADVRTLYTHQLDAWCERVRTPLESVLPSQLPDRTLGPALRKVRDYLSHAPGAPVDPEFDRVVAGLGLARAVAEAEARRHLNSDAVWASLRRLLDEPRDPAAERME